MHIEDGRLVMGRKPCTACRYQPVQGTEPTMVLHAACKGTGRGPRGGKDGCRNQADHGFMHTFRPGDTILRPDGTSVTVHRWGESCIVYDHDNRVPCHTCGGDFADREDENWTDNVPADIAEHVASLPILYNFQNREGSFIEQYIGAGFYSCTDYGQWRDKPLDDLEAKVRADIRSGFQACKAVDGADTLRLADGIGIALRRDGYTVMATLGGRAIGL